MAEVHEVRTARRGRVWPAVVMLLLVLLLIGIIVAMVMNIRGSISWPAGGVEFGFRPNLYVARIEPVSALQRPTTLATDVAPATAPPVPSESSPPVNSDVPAEIRPQPVE
jgi:hypothetical protein